MLSNAYFVAKFHFDTAENEPAKNLQNFRKMHFAYAEVATVLGPGGGPSTRPPAGTFAAAETPAACAARRASPDGRLPSRGASLLGTSPAVFGLGLG